MVQQLVTRFRALLGGRGDDERVDGGFEEVPGVPGFDPEWDELIAWARESEDEAEWTAMIARAKQAAAPPPSPPLAPPPAGSIASLSARLSYLAAQVPNARRAR